MLGAILGIGQALYGGYQAYKSSQDASEYQKKMEKLAANSPLAKRNTLIDNYAQEAANRYNENPYQSAFYQNAAKNARRYTSSALNAANDRRSAIGLLPKLGVTENNALGNAGVQAESYKERQFENMGRAAQQQEAQNRYLFDINEATPYNRRFGLSQMASQRANDQTNAGLQMMAQGIGNAAAMYNAEQSNKLSKEGLQLQKDYYSGKLGNNTASNTSNFGYNPQTGGFGTSRNSGFFSYGMQPNGTYKPFSTYTAPINPLTGKPYGF
jgi:hypothetical protein